ncbi:MAG: Crp/Fnr family transcriptional regulator [Lachnospiraceae bacterium]
MIKYLNILRETELFHGLPDNKVICLAESKACYIKEYHKGETIYGDREPVTHAGIVLEGTVDVIHLSVNGHDTIVKRMKEGDSFGVSYACSKEENLLNDIRSRDFSRILFVHMQLLLQEYCIQDDYYRILTENIFSALARHNIRLNAKIQILGQKTLREKLMAYFEFLSKEKGDRTIILPFNREELACFLCSERSSVSRELSKLSEERVIRIRGRQIELL